MQVTALTPFADCKHTTFERYHPEGGKLQLWQLEMNRLRPVNWGGLYNASGCRIYKKKLLKLEPWPSGMREVGEFLPRILQLFLPVAFTMVAPVVGSRRETYSGEGRINLVGP
jgi:hypothetical protein